RELRRSDRRRPFAAYPPPHPAPLRLPGTQTARGQRVHPLPHGRARSAPRRPRPPPFQRHPGRIARPRRRAPHLDQALGRRRPPKEQGMSARPVPIAPPRAAVWLLAASLSAGEREAVIGDLTEVFADRVDGRRRFNRLWFAAQAVGFAVAAVGAVVTS